MAKIARVSRKPLLGKGPAPRIDSAFSRAVLRWFDVYGRHDLPWQRNRDPYRIWVSEIMLQQTQVTTVIPYYERFLSRFPDLKTLARARIDSVLAIWTGLGYYARARNLHQAARVIEKRFHGVFPDRLEDVMDLPGVGRSTAGAVLSFSKHQRHPILDGNVRRVLARCFAIPDDVTTQRGQQPLWDIAEGLLPVKGSRVAAFNQAMMDLGATLCTRRNPACTRCPLRTRCQAQALGEPERYPVKKRRRERPTKETRLLILRTPDGHVLLCRRPARGVWGGLWGFPECESNRDPEQAIREIFGVNARWRRGLPSIEHGFSHFTLRMKPEVLTVSGPAADKMQERDRRWVDPGSIGRLGMAAPTKVMLDQLDKESNGQ